MKAKILPSFTRRGKGWLNQISKLFEPSLNPLLVKEGTFIVKDISEL